MFSDITIMIPTLGRVNRQVTLANLPKELLDRTTLLVDDSELGDYDFEWGLYCRVTGVPANVKGIAAVRQHAIDICQTRYLFLVDDDMVFFKRQPDSIKLDKCTDKQTIEMFDELIDWMSFEYLPLVGLSARQGNNHVEEDYRDIARQMNFHGIDVKEFKNLGLRFDGSEVMEDFNLLLTMFTRGIPNRVMYQYCWNQLGSGADGGCSSYRTNELQTKCAEELKAKFPDFVSLVIKKSKSSWKGMETRTDVRVQWKRAYESSDL